MGMAFSGFQPPKEWDNPLAAGGPVTLNAPAIQAPIAPPKPGFSEPGGVGESLRRLAASLMMGGGNNQGGSAILNQLQQQQEQDSQDSYRRAQLALQGQIANTRADTEPAVVKTLRAAGIDPQSEYGRQLIANSVNRPIIVGSPDTNQMVMGGGFGMPGGQPAAPAGPTAEAVSYLKANPSLAPAFDEKYGPGAAARALNGQ